MIFQRGEEPADGIQKGWYLKDPLMAATMTGVKPSLSGTFTFTILQQNKYQPELKQHSHIFHILYKR